MSQSQINLWKSELSALWMKLEVQNFLTSIGVDYEMHFDQQLKNSKQFSNPYLNHTWVIQSHSQLPLGVLHAYPNQIGQERVIWEEWFLLNGEIRHHVLSNLPLEKQDGVWQPEPTDQDHPEITLNRSWNYRIEPRLNPILL